MSKMLHGVQNLGDLVATFRAPDASWITEVAQDGRVSHFTYGDLLTQADAVGRGLLTRDLRRGARIGLLAENSARFLIAYFGIMRAGLCAVPMNFKLPPESIAHIVADADVRITLTDAPRIPLLPEGHPRLSLDDDTDWGDLLDPGILKLHQPEPREPANILYTSGSTGKPKGVPLTHSGFIHAVRAALRSVERPWDARVLVAAPLYHMNALFFSKVIAAGGAEEILMRQFSARDFLRAISEHRVTYLTAIPTMIALALRETDLIDNLDLTSVETIVIGSSPVTEELMRDIARVWPQAQIAITYGTTESGPTAFMPHPDGRPTPWPALGVESDMAEVKLVGDTETEGTLWIRSPVVMPGYLNLPEKTAECLKDGWYDTGDVMRRDADGFYYFVDRADDMFVCGGENIHPGDVEALLQRHPEIVDACVVPVPDRIKGQLPAAYVVRRRGSTLDAEEVRCFALENGPVYQHPRFVEFVDKLPLQGTNKVDRKALKARAAAFSRDLRESKEELNR